MTFTYSGDPNYNDKDQARFLTGDTDSDDQMHSDEEIAWMLTRYPDPTRASIELLETAASKAARMVDTTSGEIKVALSQRYSMLCAQADKLKQQLVRQNPPKIYAGGQSESERQTDRQDTDLTPGRFARDQFLTDRWRYRHRRDSYSGDGYLGGRI